MCKFEHMKLMLCEVEEESEEEEIGGEEEKEEVEELKTLQLSLHCKEGLTSNKSFWGDINGRQVLTLIDSEATSNFIAPCLIEELKIDVVDTLIYVIKVGIREHVKNKGVFRDLNFTVQGVNFQQHFFLMEQGGAEMVLGMDWLASLDNIEANFRN